MTGLKLLLTFGGAYLFALWPAVLVAADPTPGVDIRSEEGKVVIAANQIRSYEWATHTLTLAPRVREELASRLAKDRIVSGIPFTIAVGGKDVYAGTFTTTFSSQSFSTPVIVVDAQAVEAKLGEDQLRIQLGYPTAKFFRGDDPRAASRIQQALKTAGKLAEAKPEHSKGKEEGPSPTTETGAD